MRIILLSGGSGKRLWPLSNDVRSKQFLKVLQDDSGIKESMVQRVWRQLGQAGLQEQVVVATGKGQVDLLQSQLGENVDLAIEPSRRDTFPAILLACTYLWSYTDIMPDEPIVVMPVDSYVDDSYFSILKRLSFEIEKYNDHLGLMGVVPTYPSEKYGYIIPEGTIGQGASSYKVSHFIEKPSIEKAQELIGANAFWNCGVFSFTLSFLRSFVQTQPFLYTLMADVFEDRMNSYDLVRNIYLQLPQKSFDYGVVEHLNNIILVPYCGDWKDLGTWNTLTEELPQEVVGKGEIYADCSGTHIINELEIPIKVLGVKDTVVVASADGILVADKSQSGMLKTLLDQSVSKEVIRPMYEERRWGWYRVLDYTKQDDGREVLTKRICLTGGNNLSYQYHKRRKEIWTIILGTGEFVLNGVKKIVGVGDILNIDYGAKHAIRAITDLEFIEVQIGDMLIEEDIVRLAMKWDEVHHYLE